MTDCVNHIAGGGEGSGWREEEKIQSDDFVINDVVVSERILHDVTLCVLREYELSHWLETLIPTYRLHKNTYCTYSMFAAYAPVLLCTYAHAFTNCIHHVCCPFSPFIFFVFSAAYTQHQYIAVTHHYVTLLHQK